jgi:hypothetical protein
MSVRTSAALPWTWSSLPGWRFSFATSPATSPLSRAELFHCGRSRLVDTTYLGKAFSRVARGSPGSVTRDQ